MRHHRRRALCITFRLRQFASVSSSARAMAIMGRGMDFTGHIGSTAATLIGAGTIITGTKVCVEAAVSAAAQVKAICVLRVRLLRFCFDFGKSRLLQLLIQRGKIGLQ